MAAAVGGVPAVGPGGQRAIAGLKGLQADLAKALVQDVESVMSAAVEAAIVGIADFEKEFDKVAVLIAQLLQGRAPQLAIGNSEDVQMAIKAALESPTRTTAASVAVQRELKGLPSRGLAGMDGGTPPYEPKNFDSALGESLSQVTSFFGLIGALVESVVRTDILFKEGVTPEELMEYHHFIVGLQLTWWGISAIIGPLLEVLGLGQLKTPTGILLDFVDSEILGLVHSTVVRATIKRAIADPLEAHFSRIHRFKRLSPGEAEKAYVADFITQDALVEAYAADGLNNEAIVVRGLLAEQAKLEAEGLTHLRVKTLTVQQIEAALDHDVIKEEDARVKLGKLGLTKEDTDILIRTRQAAIRGKR